MNNQFALRAKPIFKLNGSFEFKFCLNSVIDNICIDVYSWQFFLMNTNIWQFLWEVEIEKNRTTPKEHLINHNLPIIKKLLFEIGNPENLIIYNWPFCKE